MRLCDVVSGAQVAQTETVGRFSMTTASASRAEVRDANGRGKATQPYNAAREQQPLHNDSKPMQLCNSTKLQLTGAALLEIFY
jgi:hypothetical protein